MTDRMIHLHWLWHMGPKAIVGVTKAISLCGEKDLTPDDIAVDLEQATCERCQQIATEVKQETPTAPIVATEKKVRPVHNIPDGALTIRMLVEHNIKKVRSGAFDRFKMLMEYDGRKVQEFLAAGGNPETLKNAMRDGYAEVE